MLREYLCIEHYKHMHFFAEIGNTCHLKWLASAAFKKQQTTMVKATADRRVCLAKIHG